MAVTGITVEKAGPLVYQANIPKQTEKSSLEKLILPNMSCSHRFGIVLQKHDVLV